MGPTSHRPSLLLAICRAPYPAPASSHAPCGRQFLTAEPCRASDAAPLPQPYLGCAFLRCVTPSSSFSPCEPIKGLHQAPPHAHPSTTTAPPLAPSLDLTVEPHFPLLRPKRGSKRVALDLLVLPNFPTLPFLARPLPPTARISSELLTHSRHTTSVTPAPTEHTHRFPSTPSCSSTPFPLPPTSSLAGFWPGTAQPHPGTTLQSPSSF
jgi:hypothetical protein